MAINAVTTEEYRSANIFSRTHDFIRAATSDVEEAMFNLFTHVSTPPSSTFTFGSAKKDIALSSIKI